MRLADFILRQSEPILAQWEAYAVRRRASVRAVCQFRAKVGHRVITAELLDEPQQWIPTVSGATRACNIDVACFRRHL